MRETNKSFDEIKTKPGIISQQLWIRYIAYAETMELR
ncbi:MAG: hypothetical protein BROFUL_02737 [Candidatus Brocadia fulgida]|uniref:Uncharacterized protein n=1 Tax=Candidatus Brocadia fulgida TaxID=380242 RepID=A0A0M2UVN2_9BACT|nr:MAG: hypothetical protein BROFUL_02737 [Candidatus Brocadia fulgida]